MKRNITYMAVFLLLVTLLCGCGAETRDLTSEQQSEITEYAVGVLLKHSKKGKSRLEEVDDDYVMSTFFVPEEETEPEPVEEVIEETEETALPDDGADNVDVIYSDSILEELNGSDNHEKTLYSVLDMEEFLHLTDVKFTYNGYEVTDVYPPESENSYFNMSAQKGKTFVVLKFLIENTGTDSLLIDMNQQNVIYSFRYEGGKKYNLQHPMIENDLYSFRGVLEPGEGKELVGIAELPLEETTNIFIPALVMTDGDNTATIRLE